MELVGAADPSPLDVVSGLPHGLTEAAVRALVSSTFEPAYLRGEPVSVPVIQPVRFMLED